MSSTSSFGLLLVGRFILGFAVALSAIAECIYIAEISTPDKRGDILEINKQQIFSSPFLPYNALISVFHPTDGAARILL